MIDNEELKTIIRIKYKYSGRLVKSATFTDLGDVDGVWTSILNIEGVDYFSRLSVEDSKPDVAMNRSNHDFDTFQGYGFIIERI